MGYKSVIRSAGAAANQYAKEQERERKKQLRELEKLKKKVDKIEMNREKVSDYLKNELAKGKLNKSEYTKLLKRVSEITDDLIFFGGTPLISAAKRYVSGKINKKDFNTMCIDILGDDIFDEKKVIIDEYETRIKGVKEIIKMCDKKIEKECQLCGKKGSFFVKIHNIQGVKLCKKDKKNLKTFIDYPGYNGYYYTTEPHIIDLDKNQLNINLNLS